MMLILFLYWRYICKLSLSLKSPILIFFYTLFPWPLAKWPHNEISVSRCHVVFQGKHFSATLKMRNLFLKKLHQLFWRFFTLVTRLVDKDLSKKILDLVCWPFICITLMYLKLLRQYPKSVVTLVFTMLKTFRYLGLHPLRKASFYIYVEFRCP